jgi:hypothetical protein
VNLNEFGFGASKARFCGGWGGGGCILRRSQTGDRPEEDLVKFGYRPNIKVIKRKNPSVFWLPAGTYCRNLVISKIKNKKIEIWRIGDHSFGENQMYVSKSYFSG